MRAAGCCVQRMYPCGNVPSLGSCPSSTAPLVSGSSLGASPRGGSVCQRRPRASGNGPGCMSRRRARETGLGAKAEVLGRGAGSPGLPSSLGLQLPFIKLIDQLGGFLKSRQIKAGVV